MTRSVALLAASFAAVEAYGAAFAPAASRVVAPSMSAADGMCVPPLSPRSSSPSPLPCH